MKKAFAILLALLIVGLVACKPYTEPKDQELSQVSTKPTSLPVQQTSPDEEILYIPVIGKGFQHQFWKLVATGSMAAAEDYGVRIYFDAPMSETEKASQVHMVEQELCDNPDALVLAALDPAAFTDILQECANRDIPVIGFDSGIPGDTSGAVKATVCTNNEAAAAIAAQKFGEHTDLIDLMQNATIDAPVRIAVLSQDSISTSVVDRTTGFINEMYRIAEQYGTVAVTGHDLWNMGNVNDASIIIHVAISQTPEDIDMQNSATHLLSYKDLIAVFCSNEGATSSFLSVVSKGEDLADGGKYADLVVVGFDAGKTQKDALRQGLLYGSITQDPYHIGYYAVEMAIAAAKGETVNNIYTTALWYDSSNIDIDEISLSTYD